jgi:chemotaxis protein methyltransferase CheR
MSLTETDFAFVTDLIRQRSSINLQPGKRYLVESRLAPMVRQCGDLNTLVGRLRGGDPELSDAVVDALTTNETSWFRDSQSFQVFLETLLPAAVERASGSTLNIWSAACSSGQETYSLAMTLLDWLPANPGVNARILGTDISSSMIDRARAGRFSQLEVNRGLPARNLVTYFDQSGRDWVIRPQVRDLVRFQTGNLAIAPVGVPNCDIVFLRNVLIYFDLETKYLVLQNVRRVLRRGGFLVLGGAESALDLDDAFRRLELDKVVVLRHEGGTP